MYKEIIPIPITKKNPLIEPDKKHSSIDTIYSLEKLIEKKYSLNIDSFSLLFTLFAEVSLESSDELQMN